MNKEDLELLVSDLQKQKDNAFVVYHQATGALSLALKLLKEKDE